MKKIISAFCVLISVFVFSQNKSLKDKISAITAGKNATVAVSVKGIDFPFEFNSENSGKKLPVQSVFKFHIALAVLDQVDKGKLNLNQKIFIKKSDLSKYFSPIRVKYPNGDISLSLSKIIKYTVAQSDNTGCDVLLKVIGGTEIVQKFIDSKNIKDFQIKFNEDEQQSDWDRQYENFTTTESANSALIKFYKGKLLSKSSTNYLMKVMLGTTTGTNKIVEQLPKRTPVAHKTGSSGRNKDGLVGAENDIAIVTLPNGKHCALSIFVSDSKESDEVNCKIISEISKAVWDFLNK